MRNQENYGNMEGNTTAEFFINYVYFYVYVYSYCIYVNYVYVYAYLYYVFYIYVWQKKLHEKIGREVSKQEVEIDENKLKYMASKIVVRIKKLCLILCKISCRKI